MKKGVALFLIIETRRERNLKRENLDERRGRKIETGQTKQREETEILQFSLREQKRPRAEDY